jgi:hypothetical protein
MVSKEGFGWGSYANERAEGLDLFGKNVDTGELGSSPFLFLREAFICDYQDRLYFSPSLSFTHPLMSFPTIISPISKHIPNTSLPSIQPS